MLRGVQPDFLEEAEARLVQRGAGVVRWDASLGAHEQLVHWRSPCDPLMDTIFAGCNEERIRWLRVAPLLLGRRWVQARSAPLSTAEVEQLRASAADRGEKGCAVWSAGARLWPPLGSDPT